MWALDLAQEMIINQLECGGQEVRAPCRHCTAVYRGSFVGVHIERCLIRASLQMVQLQLLDSFGWHKNDSRRSWGNSEGAM